ncbi:signal recognition particle-docking protein FtsY [candidate division KSB1 bacterium]|nr:signal recognition particle-docking protein FtsY [candidate division KSB1 bacterium]
MLGVLSKFQKGLEKTRSNLVGGIQKVVSRGKLDEEMLDDLEETLLLSDVGFETTEKILEQLAEQSRKKNAATAQDIINLLREQLVQILTVNRSDINTQKPHIISVIGVNGTGKTTSIGKLAHLYLKDGQKVLLAAADTFRAAASEQLAIWAERVGADCIHREPGSDPASVAFDAIRSAKSKNKDIVLIDTAGRLHTKSNLMQELSKIHRVIDKEIPGAPHQVLLVVDATTGQNGLAQAKEFAKAVNVTGIILTKLDGTAKGGIVFSIAKQLDVPVQYVGLGEKIDDLQPFDAQQFVEALFK